MKNLTLRSLLIIGFGLLIGLLALVSGLSIYSTISLAANITDTAQRRMPNIINLGVIETNTYTIRSATMSVFSETTATPSAANNLNEVIDSRRKAWVAIDESIQKLEAIPRLVPETVQMHNRLMSDLNEYRQANILLGNTLSNLSAAAASGNEAQFNNMRDEFKKHYESVLDPSKRLRQTINESMSLQVSRNTADGEAGIAQANTFDTLITILSVAGILSSILVGFAILRAVLRQIGGEPSYIQSIMRHVSNADLSVKVDLRPNDTSSALHAISVTISRLRDIVDIISKSASEIATASEELSATSEKIAASSESQSQAATTMAASVEQMTTSIGHVSNSASDANKMAQESGEAANDGAETIRSVVTDINRVARDIGDAAKSVEELGEQSREIASVVNIIKEVADQTNLLALNAAIEAARAGEQGRGFAVVADEVRKLAERTSASTEDIARIVGLISNGTSHAVETMRQQSESVQTTVDLSQRAGTTVEKIHDASNSVLGAISEISTALSEQSSTSTEIAKNVEYIASMSEDNTIAIHEVAQATHALSNRAAQLQETVGRFKL